MTKNAYCWHPRSRLIQVNFQKLHSFWNTISTVYAMLMELVNNAQIWHKMSWPFDKNNWIGLFRNSTSATTQKKYVDEDHFTCYFKVLIGWNSYFLSVSAQTFRVLSKKDWIFLSIFMCKVTVNSVRIDIFCTVFRFQFWCFVQMSLKINQWYDIKYPGFRWLELIDTIKMKQKENSQVLLRNTD